MRFDTFRAEILRREKMRDASARVRPPRKTRCRCRVSRGVRFERDCLAMGGARRVSPHSSQRVGTYSVIGRKFSNFGDESR